MKKILNYLLVFFFVFLFPLFVSAKENSITLYLFHGDGCPHCAEEINYLNSIKKNYKNLEIVKYEVWNNDDNADLLKKVQDAYDIKRVGVPTTIIGQTAIVGYSDSTGSKLERAIKYYSKEKYVDEVKKISNGTFDKTTKKEDFFTKMEDKKDEELTISVPIIGSVNLKNVSLTSAAVLIGFIDGFNPCAMWILLFLMSVLLGMKDRKRMWIIGLSFLITSAFVYMLIMLSWINIAVKITTVIWIRNIIAIVALIGAFVNLRSFFKKNESGCEVVDDKKRKTIFKKIRKFTSEKSLFLAILGAMGLAISVNLVELACSAGLPLIFTELLVLNNVDAFKKVIYTLVYIVFFLIDDFIIFFIAMFTMKITGISTKYNKFSHLFGGIIMFLVGILLLFKPEWLMFQFK